MSQNSSHLLVLVKNAKPAALSSLQNVVEILLTSGATLDVRSNYATFSINETLVAAIHPAGESIDICIALERDLKKSFLFDPIDYNYKWRNLPTGFSLTTRSDGKTAVPFVERAVAAVLSGDVIQIDGEQFAIPKAAFQPAFKKKYRHR